MLIYIIIPSPSLVVGMRVNQIADIMFLKISADSPPNIETERTAMTAAVTAIIVIPPVLSDPLT